MWNEINNTTEMEDFMRRMWHFHDSCIKEMKYVSGAYVGKNRGMFPLNNQRILRVIIQRQSKEESMIELEFSGLKYLKLFPIDPFYTCEISDTTMIMNKEGIFWCDEGDVSENDLEGFEGTLINAEKLRWRVIENCMGSEDFYVSAE